MNGQGERHFRGGFLALLGFQHKAAALVQVQALHFRSAVATGQVHLALKGIGVVFVDSLRGFVAGEVQNLAEFL